MAVKFGILYDLTHGKATDHVYIVDFCSLQGLASLSRRLINVGCV